MSPNCALSFKTYSTKVICFFHYTTVFLFCIVKTFCSTGSLTDIPSRNRTENCCFSRHNELAQVWRISCRLWKCEGAEWMMTRRNLSLDILQKLLLKIVKLKLRMGALIGSVDLSAGPSSTSASKQTKIMNFV
jgi:hypothetical protein